MDDWLERRPLLVVAGFVGAVALIGLVLLGGGHSARILSTVGASVTSGDAGSSTGRGGPTGDSGGSQSNPTRTPNAEVAVAPAAGLLIVRTGTLRLQTAAVPSTVQRASDLVAAAGGYVEGSKETGSGSSDGATIDVRIPAAAWDRVLGQLRDLGTILGQEIGTEEVTGQVVDLDARLANLRATEAALQAIMAKATRIDDVLNVQHELTGTQGQIEALTAQVQTLRDRASYGSLTIVLSLPAAPVPTATPPPGWDPGRDAAAASSRLVKIGQTATSAAIWFAIVWIPVLVAFAVGFGIAGGLLRLAWLGLRRVGLVGSREPA